jgi:hypothetical protein
LHTEPKKHFGRLWLRRSLNIGATAKWFASLLIRSKFTNLRLSTGFLGRIENRKKGWGLKLNNILY